MHVGFVLHPAKTEALSCEGASAPWVCSAPSPCRLCFITLVTCLPHIVSHIDEVAMMAWQGQYCCLDVAVRKQ